MWRSLTCTTHATSPSMGKTDLDTDASSSSAGRHEEHSGGRSTRKRSARRGRGSSEAIAAGVGDRRGAVVVRPCSAGAALRRKKSARSARHDDRGPWTQNRERFGPFDANRSKPTTGEFICKYLDRN